MKHLLVFLFCIALLPSCRDSNATIEPAKMQQVMWDVIQLEAYFQNIILTDSNKLSPLKKAQLQEKVFELHGVSKTQYYISYEYYNAHPEYMRIIMDSITTKAERNRASVMQRKYNKGVVTN